MSHPFDEENRPLSQGENPGRDTELPGPDGETAAEAAAAEETFGYEEYDGSEVDLSGSTIFGETPVEDKKKPSGKSKRVRDIVAAVLVLAILAGAAFAIVKFIPTEEETASSSSSAASMNIPVASIAEEDIASVTLTNASGSFTLLPKVEEASAASSGSGEVINWYVEGIDAAYINTTTSGAFVDGAAAVSATRLMESGAEDLSLYGLDAPAITLKVAGKSGEGYTLCFGGDSPAADGKYARLEGSSDVYLVGSATVSNLEKDVYYFINVVMFSAVASDEGTSAYFDSDGALAKVDSVVVGGTAYASPITITSNPYDSSSYIPYIMTAPVRQNVMGDAGDALISPIKTGLTADGAYAVDPDAATLAKYHMDTPQVVVEYSVGTYHKTLKISAVDGDDSYYAVMHDSVPVIYKVAKSTLSFAGYSLTDYYNNYILLDDISTVRSVTVATAAGTHVYNLSHSTDENGNKVVTVACDGIVRESASFQNLYQFMLSCYATEFTTEAASAGSESALRLIFDYTDDAREDLQVSFVKTSDRRYHITVNGTPLGYAFSTTVESLIGYENGYYNGGTVPTP
ncbi:MAG: DUF4340 domain-containing protein [Candidatus Howiella sp.]|jgi:hypothetical protein